MRLKILSEKEIMPGVTEVQLDVKYSKKEKKLNERAKVLWCRCKESMFGSYPEDGKCSCGMYKHHVHCGTCGKISQIG